MPEPDEADRLLAKRMREHLKANHIGETFKLLLMALSRLLERDSKRE